MSITFTHKDTEFTATWIDDEETILSVVTHEPTLDNNGVDQTDWPGNGKVSKIVAKEVYLFGGGDHATAAEIIFHADEWFNQRYQLQTEI